MLNQIEGDDIIMKDCTSSNYSTFINFIRPRKRSYMEMINNSGQCYLNNRIYNYKVSDHMDKVKTSFNNNININNNQINNNLIMSFNGYNDINKAKKNFMVKKRIEYDEEKERKWVENYYKIKNAELNKLRFGS